MEKLKEQKEHKANIIEFAFYTGQLVYYEESDTGKIVEGQIQQMIFNGMECVYKLYDDNPIPAELAGGVVAESALSAKSGELSEYAKAKNALRLERQKEALAELEAQLADQKAELKKLEGQVV